MTTFPTPGPIAATLEVAGAQVRVTASDRTDTVVLVEPIDTASRKDVKVAAKTKVEFANGQLSVKTTAPGAKSGSVTITIDLPTGSSLAPYLAHSTVDAEGSLGKCELHVASGQIKLDRVDALQANLSSGEVEVGHITGDTTINGAAFITRIGQATGTVGISSSGGHVWIGHATIDIEFNTASADIDIDRADNNVTATTANGAIRIGRMTHGQAKLMNGSGNIEVGISEGIAASIDVNSERGAVHNFVSSQGEPDPSAAKVSVHARTRHGDITIHRAAS